MKGAFVAIVAELVASAAGARDSPRDRLLEVALVGRSNVGKSSLINALVRRKVARTSAAPGKTRLANFYRVQRGSAPAFYLVDLPGYGYARGGDARRPGIRSADRRVFRRSGRDGGRRSLLDVPSIRAHPGLESDLEAWTVAEDRSRLPQQ